MEIDDLATLKTLYRAVRQMNEATQTKEVMQIGLETAVSLTNADNGIMAFYGRYSEYTFYNLEPHTQDRLEKQFRASKKQQLPSILSTLQPSTPYLAVPLKAKNKNWGAVYVNKAIGTFSQQDTQQLEELTNQLLPALLKTEQMMMSQGFMSTLIHESLTPLSFIKGYTDLLLSEDKSFGSLHDEQREFLHIIRKKTLDISEFFDNLINLSSSESPFRHFKKESVNLLTCLQQAIISLQKDMVEKSQAITVNVSPLLAVYADQWCLGVVFSTLLKNAHLYTPENGRITITAESHNHIVRCAVTDTGIGITPEDQENLFTHFFRSNHTAVRKQPGNGLGLVIAKNFIEQLDGQIGVESEPGQGSTFWFTLPIVE